jgi:glycogen debranching enzyme
MSSVSETAPARDLDIAHPSLHNMRILKHKDMFALFDVSGDIPTEVKTPAGLFFNDTRILSKWRFTVHNAQYKFLSGGLDQSGIVFASHLTNYSFTDDAGEQIVENTVYVKREKFLLNNTLYDRVRFINYGQTRLTTQATLRFDSDFKDIFEVRGMMRSKTGASWDRSLDENHCETRYTGLDSITRYCNLHFSVKPDVLGLNEAVFIVTLKPHEVWEMTCQISADPIPKTFLPYKDALAAAREELQEKTEKWTPIKTDNEAFNAWVTSSMKAVSLLLTDFETGPYPYAGIPWFSVPFGRDGIITALQTLHFNPDIAKGVLRYLAKHQAKDFSEFSEAEPGKILHETRKGEMANTGEVPFGKYYGSVDSTPLFLMLAGEYMKAHKDKEILQEIMPALELALEWMEDYGDPDGDGFLEYKRHNEKGLFTQGWKDSFDSVFHENGDIAEPPVALCEVQGYAYAAYRAMAEIYSDLEKEKEAAHLNEKADALYKKFNDVFWDEDLGCYALALDANKKPCRVKSSNLGHLLWCRIVPEDRAEKIVRLLTSPEFFSGWGIRTIGMNESRYCPISYHNGTVWPHDTAVAAQGFANYGYKKEAAMVLRALFTLAKNVEHMLLPELVCGFTRNDEDASVVLYPTACSPQAWSCGAVFMAVGAVLEVQNAHDLLNFDL